MNNKEIGIRLKKFRERMGYSQADIAEKLNLSQAYISMVESGKEALGQETLCVLIEKFELNISWLLGERGPMFLEKTFKPTEFLPPIDPSNYTRKEAKAIKAVIDFLVQQPEHAGPIRDSIEIAKALRGRPWERKAYLDILKAIKLGIASPRPSAKQAASQKERPVKKSLKRSSTTPKRSL